MTAGSEGELEWVDAPNDEIWDAALAQLGGHPLQSSIWGRVRRDLDGIADHRLLARRDGVPVWMMRVEARKVARLLTVGWAPKGPCFAAPLSPDLPKEARDRLAARGFSLLVYDPWAEASVSETGGRPRTVWIDLRPGKDVLLANVDKKWRNGVRRAAKEGVSVARTQDPADIHAFARMCEDISKAKGFHLDAGAGRVAALLEARTADAEALLFVARREGVVLSGALVIRAGTSWHYFWGGTDRGAGDYRAGEAVQWAVIEAAVDGGGVLYDLEGVDDALNPGTAAFKRKMGGREVVLTGQQSAALNPLGTLLDAARKFTARVGR